MRLHKKLHSSIKHGSVFDIPYYAQTLICNYVNSTLFKCKKQLCLGMLGDRILSREDIKIDDNHYINYTIAGSQESVTLESNVLNLPKGFASMLKEYSIPPSFIIESQNCTLVGNIPTVVTNNKHILLESSDNSEYWLTRNILENKVMVAKALISNRVDYTNSYGTISPFVMRPSRSYYHWLLEYLPKIRTINKYNKGKRNQCKILIHEDHPEYVTESLELLDVPHNLITTWKGDYSFIKKLVVPRHDFRPPEPENYTPLDTRAFWLRKKAIKKLRESSIDVSNYSSKVFLSRRDANSRQLANRPQVEEVLIDHGFESYALGEMNFAEGVALFNQAETIISPHGGGLANLIFSTDTHIVELLNRDRALPGMFALSSQLDLEYSHLMCSPVGGNLYVNIEELVKKVDC